MNDPLASAPRAAVLDALAAVLRRRIPMEEALERAIAAAGGIEPRDRGFARLLLATTLRRLGQTDDLLARMLDRPEPPRADVTDLLRIGAVQILFLGTPAHAAVDTTVDLATRRRQPQAKGLVNAVLRRVAREGPAIVADQDAARLNTPGWLWLSWRQAHGTPTARAIATAHMEEPPLDLTVRGDAQAWAERLGATVLPTGSLRLSAAGPVTDLPGFAEGAWWVQDAAAAIPARLLGDVAGHRVFDLCAAPGGKTAQLAAAGARVTAVDRSEKRLRRVTETLARLGLEATTVAADVTDWTPPDGPADAVLLDAPCSATGTIRRHPDIPHVKAAGDVEDLAEVQAWMLAGVARLVRPGGLLVYCTCSLEAREGERQVDALIAGGAPFERVPVRAEEVGGEAAFLTAAGDLRTHPGLWPGRGGLDGFYAARLRRTG